MKGIKLLLFPLAALLLVGIVFGLNIFASSTPSIFNGADDSVQQPVRYGQYRYTSYDPRVINWYKLDVYLSLEPVEKQFFETGMHPFFPKGGAKVMSSRSPLTPNGQVQLTVKELGGTDRTGMAFEAWLFDEESGYALSLGSFRTVGFGNAFMDWHSDQYIDEYDYVIITEEPYPDFDPLPGKAVLQGRIPKPDYFYEREFGVSKKMYGYTLS
jgi:hypothetical protein